MSIPKKLDVNGAMILGPIQPTIYPFPSGSGNQSLNLTQTPAASDGPKNRTINSPGSFVDLFAGTGVTNATFIMLRVQGGTLIVRKTTSAGVDQLDTCSDLYVASNPISGSEITAFAVKGTAEIELTIAGS